MAVVKRYFNKFIYDFNHLDTTTRLSILAILVGILGGLSAIVFRYLITLVFFLLYYVPYTFGMPFEILLIVVPCFGGLLIGLMSTKSKEASGHGIPEIIETVAYKNGDFSYSLPFVKMVASSITLGTGGAAGKEGPICQIGGGFGSMLGQIFNLTAEEKKDLVISGVAAGLSAVFNAPLGAILFAIEIIRRDNKSPPLIPLIISSVIGAAIGIIAFHTQKPFLDFPSITLITFNTYTLVIVITLGLIAGLFSVFWIKFFYFVQGLFERIKISKIAIAAFGGLLVGIMQLFLWVNNLPIIFWLELSPFNIKRRTYNLDAIATINGVFHQTLGGTGSQLLLISFILIFIGMLGTALTLGSGNSGGSLAPTLYIGVMIGAFVGQGFLEYLPLSVPNVAFISILGMAAFFAGSIRSPFTAIIMTAEMIGDYRFIVPLMFAVAVAYIVSRAFMRFDLYTYGLAKQGFKFVDEFDSFDGIFVDEIMVDQKNIIKVHEKDRLENVLQLLNQSGHTGFPVVDENNKLLGIITEHDIQNFFKSGKNLADANVGDICSRNVVTLLEHCPVSMVISVLAGRKINRLPIVNYDKILKGWVTRSDVIKIYLKHRHLEEQDKFERELFENPFVLELKK